MIKFYDRAGREITDKEWSAGLQRSDYQQVIATHIEHIITVSTVWLGVSLPPYSTPPLIFETQALFNWGVADIPGTEARYATEAEAIAGHHAIVTVVERWLTARGGDV